jgi:hypothetical protein
VQTLVDHVVATRRRQSSTSKRTPCSSSCGVSTNMTCLQVSAVWPELEFQAAIPGSDRPAPPDQHIQTAGAKKGGYAEQHLKHKSKDGLVIVSSPPRPGKLAVPGPAPCPSIVKSGTMQGQRAHCTAQTPGQTIHKQVKTLVLDCGDLSSISRSRGDRIARDMEILKQVQVLPRLETLSLILEAMQQMSGHRERPSVAHVHTELGGIVCIVCRRPQR